MDNKLKEIITKAWGKESNSSIAKTINKHGITTITGKPFSGALVSAYAIRYLGLPRQKNTSQGEAGTTGIKITRRRTHKPRAGSTKDLCRNIEDIMTSNLETDTKVKLVAMIAGK